jgi:large conductance mechanosensitive channel
MPMLKEFRDFITRGNVIDLAVAVVLGVAFTQVVTSFSEDILGGIIALFGGKPDLNGLSVTISDTTIFYGRFLTQVLNFIIIAFALFLVVKAINAIQNLRSEEELEDAQISEVELLTEIRDLLRSRS